jgi:RNA polymerase sigma-70 factor (ECF subfamily)
MTEDREALEKPIRDAWDADDYGRAAELSLEQYGNEILGFLSARLRSPSDAAEAFSMFTEDFWRGLPEFSWRCSMRGWAYTLARNAANRYKVSPHNRAGRNLTFTQHAPLSRLVEQVRTRTAAHLRTEVKSKMREIRERLPDDEQTLLMLRVDRGLPWRELALVLHEEEGELEGKALEQASARVRKRFQLVKDKLKRMVEEEGLI